MKRKMIDAAERAAADERLERLLDEELRAIAQPPAVDLRAKVMKAIAEAPRGEGANESARRSPQTGRWALGLAAAAAIVLAVFLAWPRPSGRPQPPQAVASAQAQPDRSMAPSIEATGNATVEPAARPGGELRAPTPHAGMTVARSTAATARARAEEVVDAVNTGEPFLPGAPAGELGDPLAPLPSPPPIAFAPIAHVPIAAPPPISESARPVTDFPAADSTSDVRGRTTAESGGMRR